MNAGYRETVGTSIRRHKGWPAPTYRRTWSEDEAREMAAIFALTEEDRHWDRLAEDAERQALIDQGLVS